VDLRAGLIHVSRKKNGVPSTHPLHGDEVRALRQLRRDWPEGRFVFATERGAPFTRSGLAKMIERASEESRFRFSGALSHAQARLRLLLCESGEGHSVIAALARASVNTTHCAVHRAER
jgi:hypothetical protein